MHQPDTHPLIFINTLIVNTFVNINWYRIFYTVIFNYCK